MRRKNKARLVKSMIWSLTLLEGDNNMFWLYTLVFLGPAYIASVIFANIQKEKFTLPLLIRYCSFYSCVILWLNTLVLYKRGWGTFAFERISVQFLMKYIPMSLIWAYVLPYFIKFIKWIIGRYITGDIKPKR